MATQGTPIDIVVTPTRRNGPDTFCRIEPANDASRQYVKGQVIFLPKNQNFALNFQLTNEQGPPLQWDSGNPFRAEKDQCPGPNTQIDGQFTVGSPSGSKLTVGAGAQSTDNVVHYRLNFVQGGSSTSCDPIIINGGGGGSAIIEDGISPALVALAVTALVALIAAVIWFT